MKNRFVLFGLILVLSFFYGKADNDYMILRSGQDKSVKVTQITNETVYYKSSKSKTALEESIPSKDIYMLYLEGQGNIYFTRDGKRITGENLRADRKKYDVIYTTSGSEIPASSIKLSPDSIKFIVNTKTSGFIGIGGKNESKSLSLPNEKVFMIIYKNGTKDIITPVDKDFEEKAKEEIKQEKPQNKYIVVFHEVVKGETLSSIADNYSVSVDELKEWNDIPKSFSLNKRLSVGMQLMIYQNK